MSEQRKLIRHKVVDLLKNADISGVCKRVFPSRQVRVAPEDTPCIMVYTKSESAIIGIAAPRQNECTLKLALEILVIDKGERVDDLMDDISEAIRQIIFRNETLDGLASDSKLSDTEIDFVTDSENEIGACRLIFDVKYWEDAPKVIEEIDDFKRYHAEHKVADSVADTVPAKDDTELAQ